MRISIFLISLVSVAQCQATDDETFLDKFRYGIELVHRLFSNDFRTFFAGAFKAQNGDNFARNFFNAVIKTVGGNEEDMGATGIRISVLVAKMISDAFPESTRSGRSAEKEFSPLETILRQPEIRNQLKDLRDPNLTDRVVKELRDDCVKLLICKVSPFFRGMQKSLDFFIGGKSETAERDTWAKSKPMERMYLFMPGMNEFLENGDACDESYPLCVY